MPPSWGGGGGDAGTAASRLPGEQPSVLHSASSPPTPAPAWELNRGVCVHTRACVCFTKYSFVSVVTPEDHANVFSTSCHCSFPPLPSSLFYFFLNENGISPIPPFRKYSPAPVNITSPPPLCAPFFHMRRQTFLEHASAPSIHLWLHKARYAPEGWGGGGGLRRREPLF